MLKACRTTPLYAAVKLYSRIHNFFVLFHSTECFPFPVAVRSRVWVCGSSLAAIPGSSLARGSITLFFECCVLSGIGIRVGLITRPEQSYRVRCVCMSVIVKCR